MPHFPNASTDLISLNKSARLCNRLPLQSRRGDLVKLPCSFHKAARNSGAVSEPYFADESLSLCFGCLGESGWAKKAITLFFASVITTTDSFLLRDIHTKTFFATRVEAVKGVLRERDQSFSWIGSRRYSMFCLALSACIDYRTELTSSSGPCTHTHIHTQKKN